MPRPPPRTGSADWTGQHHRLSDDARENLMNALGLDPSVNPDDMETAIPALAEVEKWLGSYSGADNALKNAPKASDFVRSLSSIESDTVKLLSNLNVSHQWIRDELVRTNIDLEKLALELEKLQAASLYIKGKYEGIESRGAPKQEALRDVILRLREVFARYYQGPNTSRQEIGYVRPLSEYENEEREFINFALDDTDIPYTEKDLDRILAEPNVTVKANRREAIYSERNIARAKNKQHRILKNSKK